MQAGIRLQHQPPGLSKRSLGGVRSKYQRQVLPAVRWRKTRYKVVSFPGLHELVHPGPKLFLVALAPVAGRALPREFLRPDDKEEWREQPLLQHPRSSPDRDQTVIDLVVGF